LKAWIKTLNCDCDSAIHIFFFPLSDGFCVIRDCYIDPFSSEPFYANVTLSLTCFFKLFSSPGKMLLLLCVYVYKN